MADITRTVDGLQVPAAGTYAIDVAHTAANFSVRHMGLSKVRGSIPVSEGTVVIAENPADSTVEVSLDAANFTTGSADRDGHVKSADFLDVENFPTMTFRTVGLRADGDDWKLDGELTVRDVTKPVQLEVEFEGGGDNPWGVATIAFSASTEINREDFGITWNQALETGGVLVGKKVSISLDVEANPA